jgi:hypothetical protein
MQTLPKAVPESMFQLTGFAVRTPEGFRKLLVYSESGLQKPSLKATGVFQLAGHDREKTFILITHQRLTERVFIFIADLLEPVKALDQVSVRTCIINKCFLRSSFKMCV